MDEATHKSTPSAPNASLRSSGHALSSTAGSYAAETFYKHQLEIANKERAHLQQRLRHVEDQNKLLLKSLFELSCAPAFTPSSTFSPSVQNFPFDVVSALRNISTPATVPTSSTSGKGSASRRSGSSISGVTSINTLSALLDRTTTLQSNVSPTHALFRHRADLSGHSAAVYAVQFSPNGHLLVSVSFDKSVRFWPIGRLHAHPSQDSDSSISDAHRAPIVAVEWATDSTRVITGSLDQSVAEWDVQSTSNDPIHRYSCMGLVNSVSVSPADTNVFFVASTRKQVVLLDRRAAHTSTNMATDVGYVVVDNDTVVNTVHVTLDGLRLITGDHGGAIKTWDMREGRGNTTAFDDRPSSTLCVTPLGLKYNGENRRPITHIHTSPPLPGERHGRFMAVNSYDTYLRVYDRGSVILPDAKPELTAVHALRGVVNAHWPIKSSFFLGADYVPSKESRRTNIRTRRRDHLSESKSAKSDRTGDDDNHDGLGVSDESDVEAPDSSSESEDDAEEVVDADDASSATGKSRQDDGAAGTIIGDAIQTGLVLASGSADGRVYVFDVGGRRGRGRLLQTLDGHDDRVYATDFHPHEPILASCCADASIKIWQAK